MIKNIKQSAKTLIELSDKYDSLVKEVAETKNKKEIAKLEEEIQKMKALFLQIFAAINKAVDEELKL